jgi:HlyD family secretion protein
MDDMKDKLFRKVSLDRLSSPEQLDALMRVITAKSWIALAPLLLLIVLAMVWGWFGKIPTKVSGKCMLINPLGLSDVSAASAGRVIKVLVAVGDPVKSGQEVARIAQPELADQIDKAESRLRELQARGRSVRAFASQGSTLTAQSLAGQKTNLEAQLRASLEKAKFAGDRIKVQTELLAQGLVTQQAVLSTRTEQVSAELEADRLRSQLKELSLNRLESEKRSNTEIANIDIQTAEAQRSLDSLTENRRLTTAVTSAVDGRVVELKVAPGALVSTGVSMLSVEQSAVGPATIEAVIYVPAAEGKQIQKKMAVQIVPSTVKREEYGFMNGTVTYVADYPTTIQSMTMLLQNDSLVRELAGKSTPIEVRAALIADANHSGYKWSSAAGAPVKVHAGTLCASEIVVREQRPLSLVLPILKKSLALD